MASCVAGGAELEPPVRAPHTVYMKSLVSDRRPGLLPSSHHQGRGCHRRRRRDQTRRWTGGGRAEGSAPTEYDRTHQR